LVQSADRSRPLAQMPQQVAKAAHAVFNTGSVQQGYLAIGSTTTNIFCTAMIIDAANAKPVGTPFAPAAVQSDRRND
jgi:hypothetical protein